MLQISSCQAAPNPTITSTNISTKLLPKSTSALAQLLATATASENTKVYPLGAVQQNKKKPKKFRSKGEPRFRTTNGRNSNVNFLQHPNSSKIERVRKSPFSGFSK
jgi:hypothetical protein